jgi:SAM-dependent methyltransferase
MYLNLGCGNRYVPAWVNIDRDAKGPGIRRYDLAARLPFEDGTFPLVYSSHVLEHFTKLEGEGFLKEAIRVLQPGGVLRVVVPDLERIANLYLNSLSRAVVEESSSSAADYDWAVLMLYDQTVRNHPGGLMAEYLRSERIQNPQFVLDNCGSEMRPLMRAASGDVTGATLSGSTDRRLKLGGCARRRIVSLWKSTTELLSRRMLGADYETVRLGQFRMSGEVHQWMYDRYSLKRLMEKCGAITVARMTAAESHIPHWTQFNLDTEPDGTVYKPESLYMEGIKPNSLRPLKKGLS